MVGEQANVGDTSVTRHALSIGALSQATDIPVETLRTWERRYGFPQPAVREGRGHRRYPIETIERLRLIKRALGRGHRPATIVGASVEELMDLLRSARPLREGSNSEAIIERWLEFARVLDGVSLSADFERVAAETGLRSFVQEHAARFVECLGEKWARGEIQVFQEHFASEQLSRFLSDAWQRLSPGLGFRTVVCAALPGEQHVLGLHMAALVLAAGGWKIVFLGANSPVDAVAGAVEQVQAQAVAVSVSRFADAEGVTSALREMRDQLPADTQLIVGGAGGRVASQIPGTRYLRYLSELSEL